MSSKTKIIVLHLKELIYTGIFVVLGILFVVLLVIMFSPKETEDPIIETSATYIPGIYTTSLVISDTTLDVEVVVNSNEITSISLVNLEEAITTMYPLMEPALEELSIQIIENQSLQNISYSDDNKYTSMVLLNAIASSLDQAYVVDSLNSN